MSEEKLIGHDGKPWPDTFDGYIWAKEFCNRFPSIEVDDAISWFCNAIMRGYDEANWKRDAEIRRLSKDNFPK